MNFPQEIIQFARDKKSSVLSYHKGNSKKRFKSFELLNAHQLNALVLLSCETPVELCQFLKIHFFRLEKIINAPCYKHYQIAKKRGGTRDIYEPSEELKFFQKRLNYFLQAWYLWIKPKEVHGFVINPKYLGKHCNIVANAAVHTGKKYVLNIDLQDFFPGISAWQVREVFLSELFGFNEQIANALTLLTTYEGKLPTGAPTSPVISNFVCHQLDKDLVDFSMSKSIEYSRYADDLTFSSNSQITTDIILDLISLINKNNFRINEKKLRLRTSNSRQTVTGLTVNTRVNVNRKLLKKIRAMLHDLDINGLESAAKRHFRVQGKPRVELEKTFILRLQGYINFVGQVRGLNDPLYQRFKTQFHTKKRANLHNP
jgi:RNA-directed DNA polymerase